MMSLLSETNPVTQITAGLGVIAAALVAGQYLVYKFLVTPDRARAAEVLNDEIKRADKALTDEQARAAKALADEQTRAAKSLMDEQTRAAKALQDERERSERLEAEVRRQNEVLQEKALPALIVATSTVGESQALLRELKHEQEMTRRERDRDRDRDARLGRGAEGVGEPG